MKVKLALLLGLVIVVSFVWALTGRINGIVYYEPGDDPVGAGIPVVVYNNSESWTVYTTSSGTYLWIGDYGFYSVYSYDVEGNPQWWSDTFGVALFQSAVEQDIILYEME